MTQNLIGSDHPLSQTHRSMLPLVLNLIVPPSADGRMPGAADVDVLAHLTAAAADSIPLLRDEFDRLEAEANARFAASFIDLGANARQRLVASLRTDDPGFMRLLALNTVTCYYQDERVMAGLGMPPRAPFPQGFDVKTGDLTLLDPVRQRGPIWREPDKERTAQ